MNPREINTIYDSFPEGQTMPRQQFIKRVQELTDVAGVQKDLGRIMAQKQTQAIIAAREKQRIDEAIGK